MSKITITRSNEWINGIRRIIIYVDNQELDSILNGQTKTFEISPGTHSLKAKIDWCGSKPCEFTIAENEVKNFKLSSFKHSDTIMLVMLLLILLSAVLKNNLKLDYFGLLALLPVLVVVYYISIGRKDYLILKESN